MLFRTRFRELLKPIGDECRGKVPPLPHSKLHDAALEMEWVELFKIAAYNRKLALYRKFIGIRARTERKMETSVLWSAIATVRKPSAHNPKPWTLSRNRNAETIHEEAANARQPASHSKSSPYGRLPSLVSLWANYIFGAALH